MTRAFTLIELLVVITIIVVLLALLAPAMDKAIYSAELTVCGTNQKQIATGAMVYAAENRRTYPYRPMIDKGGWKRPNSLFQSKTDDRPYLRQHINMKAMSDPLAGQIDVEALPVPPDDGTLSNIFSSYELWFGMRYTSQAFGGKGMYKVGDRFEWKGNAYRLLASDEDATQRGQPVGTYSHPDRDGITTLHTSQNEPQKDYGVNSEAGGYYTMSRWSTKQMAPQRGPIDANYAYDDGSVARFYEVLYDENLRDDPRMDKVPISAKDSDDVFYIQVPAR